jgi:hypothetical protein
MESMMSKQDWTMYIYKTDRRKKTGERQVSTTVWTGRDQDTMQREVNELYAHHYPREQFRIEFVPTTKQVKNLMTGEMVTIAWDTPRSCDPSTELYWSM